MPVKDRDQIVVTVTESPARLADTHELICSNARSLKIGCFRTHHHDLCLFILYKLAILPHCLFIPFLIMSIPSNIPLKSLSNLLLPISLSPQPTFTNWGLTFTCSPLAVFQPTTEYQCALILELAKREGKTVRAVGVGHSPSDLACTSEYMLRTSSLNNLLEVREFFFFFLFWPFRDLPFYFCIKKKFRGFVPTLNFRRL